MVINCAVRESISEINLHATYDKDIAISKTNNKWAYR